ncbi:MAG: PEGA domain-containing protein [Byssovorax sp.]
MSMSSSLPFGGRLCAAAPKAVALCAVLALSLTATSASAQLSDADKGTARALAQQGQDALDKRDFATAADRFARAGELVHAPTLLLGLARAQVGLGKWVAAEETYYRLVHEPAPPNAPPAFAKALADARKDLAALEPRVPSVTIVVKGAPSARVTLDGTPVPSAALGVARPVDPGKHAVRAEADGFAPAQSAFTVAEHKNETVTLTLEHGRATSPENTPPVAADVPGAASAIPPTSADGSTAPPPASSPRPLRTTLGFVGLGVGGAGLILGAVTGGLAIPKHNALKTTCPDGMCTRREADAVGSYHLLTTLSTVGFIAGGVLATTGLVLVLTTPRAAAPASSGITPVIGAGFAGAQGWF